MKRKRFTSIGSRLINKCFIPLWIVCFCAVSFSGEEQTQKATIGLYPLLSPSLLTHRLQPLADFIRSTGVKSVTIKVDVSYEDFIRNARRGEYDIVQAPAHIAAYLIEKEIYEPVIKMGPYFSSVLLARADSPLKRITDLKNKIIAIPNPYAFVTIAAITRLQDAGLTENNEYTILRKATHDRTLMAIRRKEADAGVMSSAMLAMVDTTIRKELKILSKIDSLAADLLLVRKGSSIADKGPDYFRNFVSGKYGKLFLEKWKIGMRLEAISSFDTKSIYKYTQVIEGKIEAPQKVH